MYYNLFLFFTQITTICCGIIYNTPNYCHLLSRIIKSCDCFICIYLIKVCLVTKETTYCQWRVWWRTAKYHLNTRVNVTLFIYLDKSNLLIIKINISNLFIHQDTYLCIYKDKYRLFIYQDEYLLFIKYLVYLFIHLSR